MDVLCSLLKRRSVFFDYAKSYIFMVSYSIKSIYLRWNPLSPEDDFNVGIAVRIK